MRLVFKEFAFTFEFGDGGIHTLIIEKPELLYSLVLDLYNQIDGLDGNAVLSDEGKIIDFKKSALLLQNFIPFSVNQKSLITRITTELEDRALSDEYYHQTTELLSEIEKYLLDLSLDYRCGLDFSKLSVGALIKASGVEIQQDDETLCEKLVDYMELTTDLLGEKLFITVGLRNFISDQEAEILMETVLQHGLYLFMIESHERKRLRHELRHIVDESLCEIS